MNSLLAAAAVLLASIVPLSACADPDRSAGEASRPVAASQVAAIRVYADWCPNCRALDPKLEAVTGSQDWGGVSFVRIDYTNRDKEAAFSEADRLGVGEAVRTHFANGIKTGLLLLVDVETQTVIDLVTHQETEAEISDRIRAAQAGA
jgi:thiol-disulfide isomerase/thioredoxin